MFCVRRRLGTACVGLLTIRGGGIGDTDFLGRIKHRVNYYHLLPVPAIRSHYRRNYKSFDLIVSNLYIRIRDLRHRRRNVYSVRCTRRYAKVKATRRHAHIRRTTDNRPRQSSPTVNARFANDNIIIYYQ